MTTQQSIDQAKTDAFLGKVLGDTSGMTVTIMASIGDRLGLFKNLSYGSATSAQLAVRAGINDRYTREWLGSMVSAGYVEYNPTNGRFTLPPEYIPVLVQEGGPIFFGGVHQLLIGMVGPLKQIEQAFRQGGGVPPSAYDDNMWEGMERFTAGWFENLLVKVWILAMPDGQVRLKHGAKVANFGCGRGRTSSTLAQPFPTTHSIAYNM